MRVRVGARTDIGRVRERNEDAYLVQEPLFAVADGMGGHRGGDVASSLTVKALEHAALPPDSPLRALVEHIKEANAEVLRRGESDDELRGMGTTLTAVLADQDKAYVAHVGDSRAYLLRDGAIQRLTRDHTLVERMVEEGRLEAAQARFHPQRSILTRALGVDEEVQVDDLTVDPIQPGDRILLCTDGLTSMVDEDTVQEILADEADPQAACDRLVEAAIRAGGDDNVTVVVLDFETDGDPSAGGTAVAGATEPPTGASGDGISRGRTVVGEAPGPGEDTTARDEEVTDREAPQEPREGIRWGRVALWVAVAAVLVAAALVGVRLYVGQQWYVGDAGGRVAIYNGIPTEVLGFELSHVDQTTDLRVAEVERLAFWQDLRDGITADSLEEARSIVNQMRQDLRTEQGGRT